MRSTGSCCVSDDDLNACADLVRRGDPERFLAVMAAPVAAREKLFPIYAFNVEVARAPWVTQEAMIAEMRLQWWRDALQEIRAGGHVRRHEVATPLSQVLDAEGAALLDQLVAARRWDIYHDPFENIEHFREYIGKTSGNLLLAAARSLGPVPEAPVRDAGYALGVANWLRAVPALERAGRVPLADGTRAGVQQLAQEGLAYLEKARVKRADIGRRVAPALLCLWQAGAVLRRAVSSPGRVASGGLEPSPVASRINLMLRAATGRW